MERLLWPDVSWSITRIYDFIDAHDIRDGDDNKIKKTGAGRTKEALVKDINQFSPEPVRKRAQHTPSSPPPPPPAPTVPVAVHSRSTLSPNTVPHDMKGLRQLIDNPPDGVHEPLKNAAGKKITTAGGGRTKEAVRQDVIAALERRQGACAATSRATPPAGAAVGDASMPDMAWVPAEWARTAAAGEGDGVSESKEGEGDGELSPALAPALAPAPVRFADVDDELEALRAPDGRFAGAFGLVDGVVALVPRAASHHDAADAERRERLRELGATEADGRRAHRAFGVDRFLYVDTSDVRAVSDERLRAHATVTSWWVSHPPLLTRHVISTGLGRAAARCAARAAALARRAPVGVPLRLPR